MCMWYNLRVFFQPTLYFVGGSPVSLGKVTGLLRIFFFVAFCFSPMPEHRGLGPVKLPLSETNAKRVIVQERRIAQVRGVWKIDADTPGSVQKFHLYSTYSLSCIYDRAVSYPAKYHGHDRISTTLSLFSRLSFPTPVHFLPTCLRHLIKTCATWIAVFSWINNVQQGTWVKGEYSLFEFKPSRCTRHLDKVGQCWGDESPILPRRWVNGFQVLVSLGCAEVFHGWHPNLASRIYTNSGSTPESNCTIIFDYAHTTPVIIRCTQLSWVSCRLLVNPFVFANSNMSANKTGNT